MYVWARACVFVQCCISLICTKCLWHLTKGVQITEDSCIPLALCVVGVCHIVVHNSTYKNKPDSAQKAITIPISVAFWAPGVECTANDSSWGQGQYNFILFKSTDNKNHRSHSTPAALRWDGLASQNSLLPTFNAPQFGRVSWIIHSSIPSILGSSYTPHNERSMANGCVHYLIV